MFPKIGVPQKWKIPIRMDDLGVSLFFGNTQIVSHYYDQSHPRKTSKEGDILKVNPEVWMVRIFLDPRCAECMVILYLRERLIMAT